MIDKKNRNRLSLILQLGSPSHPFSFKGSEQPQTLFSRFVSPSSHGRSNALPSPGAAPSSPWTAVGNPGSPDRSTSPVSLCETPTSGPPSVAMPEDPSLFEKTRMIKQARKISQIFGEAIFATEEAGVEIVQSGVAKWAKGRQPRQPCAAPNSRKRTAPSTPARHPKSRRTKTLPSFSVYTTRQPDLPQPPAVPSIRGSEGARDMVAVAPLVYHTGVDDAPPNVSDSPLDRVRRSHLGHDAIGMGDLQNILPNPDSPCGAHMLLQGSAARLARTNSSRSVSNPARGRSLDLSSRHPLRNRRPSSRPATSSGQTDTDLTFTPSTHSLRKTKSLWAKKGRRLGDPVETNEHGFDREAITRDLMESFNMSYMTKAQRSLSLKRARKLNHVFGSEPPAHAIFQPLVAHEMQGERDSSTSCGSVTSSIDLISVDVSRVVKHRSHSIIGITSIPCEPTSPVPAVSPVHKLARSHQRAPSSPSPFVEVKFGEHLTGSPTPPSPSLSSEQFRQRRLRAAKLARFFGVETHEMLDSVCQLQPAPALETTAPSSPPQSPNLDILIQEPGKFWTRPDKGREVDMSDVISLLRELR